MTVLRFTHWRKRVFLGVFLERVVFLFFFPFSPYERGWNLNTTLPSRPALKKNGENKESRKTEPDSSLPLHISPAWPMPR